MSEFARIALLALLAVLAQSPQGAPPSSSQQPPRFRGGTNLVRVDAFATKDGVPVLDLKADDFEVFEDGAPQKIENFEHIVIESTPPGGRVDPSSIDQANQLAADPHRRVFVIYLDTEHVDFSGRHDITQALIDFMNRTMSDDDLVGVLTPEMGPQQLTFGRRTDVIERGLRTNWTWGRRGDYVNLDDREKLYDMCFPPIGPPVDPFIPVSPLAKEMIDRRREKMVLDSLSELAHYMEAIRDGRTAVVTVSGGWALVKPDPTMLNPRKTAGGANVDPMPGTPPPVGVGRGGTLTTRPGNGTSTTDLDRTECDTDRYTLANLEDDTYLRNIIGEANRANVTFYTINPAGLIEYDPVHNPRTVSLEMLSTNTNGLALLYSNDLSKEFRKIADDLTSYYLFGYYSTSPKLDGRYRTIKVRSKRPGVEVRARQGYRAASAAEVNAARASADLPVPEEKAAIVRALGTIETDARAQSRERAITRGPGEPALFHRGPSTGNQLQPASARIFPRSDRVHLELEASSDSPTWTGALLDRSGTKTAVPVTAGERTDSGSGQRWLTADVALAPLGAGDYIIELTSTAGTEQRRTLVAIRVTQ